MSEQGSAGNKSACEVEHAVTSDAYVTATKLVRAAEAEWQAATAVAAEKWKLYRQEADKQDALATRMNDLWDKVRVLR